MDLSDFNLWWKKQIIPPSLKGRTRKAFDSLLPYLTRRQGVILEGIRRAGKTTLMYQLIDYLLIELKVDSFHILYYSFDEPGGNLDEIIKYYSTYILKKDLSNEKVFFFFDEIQKLPSWADKIKILYDTNPSAKIFLSGSASLVLEKGQKESLAGRFFTIHINPLDFVEFLNFKKITYDPSRYQIYRLELEKELVNYIKTSGFPELVNESDDNFIKEYFRQTITDRIVFQDIPQTAGINEPELLKEIYLSICANPGQILRYNSFGSDFKRDRRTIQKYIYYLEYSFLAKILFNYSPNPLTRYKKNRKIYPAYTAFSFATLREDIDIKNFIGKIAENLVLQKLNTNFFYRTDRGKEIDFIATENNKVIPYEVKYRKNIDKSDLSTINSFMKEFKTSVGVIVSENTEEVQLTENGQIKFVPLIKFLLEE